MSHYYHPDTLELIDGDLRDARKVGGLPSPTTVLKILTSPGLQWYFKRQMWEAAVSTPRTPQMSDEEHWKLCQKYADEHGKAARDKGGDFHTMVQQLHLAIVGRRSTLIVPPGHPLHPQITAYWQWYEQNVEETLLVEHKCKGDGYGGQLDHMARMRDGRVACLDAKTQDISKRKNFEHYPEWGVQLGAYAGTQDPMPDCLISVCVSSMAGPVVVEAYEWPEPPAYYHQLFLGLLAYWRELHDFPA